MVIAVDLTVEKATHGPGDACRVLGLVLAPLEFVRSLLYESPKQKLLLTSILDL